MKTTIIEETTEKDTPDFPALYKSKHSALVVFMWEDRKGVVIIPMERQPIGLRSNIWDMDTFTKITTPITIKFEE